MTDPDACDNIQPLLAELAANAATGHDRARTLEHLTGCAACRDEMTRLTRTVDALLLLAPRVEPPPGFEARVLAGLEANPPTTNHPRRLPGLRRLGRPFRVPRQRRRPAEAGRHARGRRLGLRIAAIVVTAAVSLAAGAGFARSRGEQDRRLAEHYRQTLRIAEGSYLRAAQLTTPDGAQAGSVFLYQGNPSWLLVTVTAAPLDGPYRLLIVDRAGAAYAAGTCPIAGGTGTAGYRLRVPVSNISEIQLHAPTPSDFRLTART
jgi:hypothetical protein